MQHDERSIIKRLRNSAKGYLFKDVELPELKKALDAIVNKGIYINDILYNNIVHAIDGSNTDDEYT